MNSICSKNDFEAVKNELQKVGLWDLFIFPKISWKAKGEQVRQIVEQVQLRPQTVLFIDDNPTNLAEVQYYNPDINIAGTDIIDKIRSSALFEGKDDKEHSRLAQYKILEAKQIDKAQAVSNEEFLKASNVTISIGKNCNDHIQRITELINRTNQLNFTKNRLTEDEVVQLVNDNEHECAYIKARDNYGDYGIIGFYSVKGTMLDNFCFSCRTLGLGIEQFVFAKLGYPDVLQKGETVVTLKNDDCPDWISIEEGVKADAENLLQENGLKVSLVGGCDLKSVAYYLNGSNIELDTLFNFNYHNFIIHKEHTEIIRGSVEYSESEKKELIEKLPFYADDMFENNIFKQDLDVLIFSPLIDYSLGVYEKKDNNLIKFVYGNAQKPINIDDKKIPIDVVKYILENYEFKGFTDPDRLYRNLCFIRSNLNKNTLMMVLNGSEQQIEHPEEPNRVKTHIELNKAVKRFCEDNENTVLIDVNDFIHGKNDHTDSIRHYTRRVYFDIAKAIIAGIEKKQGSIKTNFVLENRKNKTNIRIAAKTTLRKLGLLKLGYKIHHLIRK